MTLLREYIRICHFSVTDVLDVKFILKDSGFLVFQKKNANLLKFTLPGDPVHKVCNQLRERPNEINIDSAFHSIDVGLSFISDNLKVNSHNLNEQQNSSNLKNEQNKG